MRMLKFLTLMMFLALAGFSANAFAAPPGFDEDRMMAAAPGTSPEKQEEMRKRVETIRMWKLKDELKLDDQTASKVSAILGKYDQKRMALGQDARKAFQELKELLKQQKPDESRLKEIIARVEKNREEMHQLMTDESAELKGVLTVEQQARYILFIPKFHHELKEMMEKQRGERKPAETKPGTEGSY